MINIIMSLLWILGSCSYNQYFSKNNEKIIKMWKFTLHKDEVVKLYGPSYNNIEEGISYPREKSTWPRFAFFFNKRGNNINQFALLDEEELKVLKENLQCEWIVSMKRQASPHVVYDIETGVCEKYNLGYGFKIDWGLYEVRLIKK